MAQIQIKPKNILEPSEKVLRMYEAVHSFMLEKRDISTIKVVDITSAAEIGKGTAYEYFSSKEEIIPLSAIASKTYVPCCIYILRKSKNRKYHGSINNSEQNQQAKRNQLSEIAHDTNSVLT